MKCPCCKTEITVTFAQHLLHTYLRRFHDLYECKHCVTYHFEPVWRIILRIVYILSAIAAVLFLQRFFPFHRFLYYIGLYDTIRGTVEILLVVLFEYVVYRCTNRNRNQHIAQEKVPINIPEDTEWKRPGFFKSLLHNYLGRFDYLFVDTKSNLYYRENHVVSCIRLIWLLSFNYFVCLMEYLCIVCEDYILTILIMTIFLLYVLPIIMEYVFYKTVPMILQPLQKTVSAEKTHSFNQNMD